LATRRPGFPLGRALAAFVLLSIGAGLALAPRLVDGYLALQWTRHLTVRNVEAPRLADARPAGRWAARAVDGLAPLPQAWEAARLALEYSKKMRLRDASAARAILSPVREALERAEASRFRGFGLGELRETVAQAENSELVLDPGDGAVK
jgi:hypothetical protein